MKHPESAALALAARERAGLSQPEFANLIDAGTRSVANWEAGLKPPLGPARLILIAIRDGVLTPAAIRKLAR